MCWSLGAELLDRGGNGAQWMASRGVMLDTVVNVEQFFLDVGRCPTHRGVVLIAVLKH